jgi:predicted RNA methylase
MNIIKLGILLVKKFNKIKIILNQDIGLKRNPIDKFYTKKEIVILCINLVKELLNITNEDLIIEPSAGNGAFIDQIKLLSNNYKFYDIKPEHKEIIKQDFLELDPNNIVTGFTCNRIYGNVSRLHIIGNPPFGRQSSTAIKFIKFCCKFSNSISFILPKSFKKDSMKNHFNINFHLIHEIDLPEKSFNNDYDVPCVFQIWIKKDIPRLINKKLEPINFKFVKKTNKPTPDISFRRVGVNAGAISKEINKSEESHYFISFTNKKSVDANIKLLENINFNHNNTVGPKSISKQELIKEFNNYII